MADIKISRFLGINQSQDQNLTSLEEAWNAENIDTSDGNLAVAKGFEKFISSAVTGTATITRIMPFLKSTGALEIVVAAGAKLYSYKGTPASWTQIKDFTTIVNNEWSYISASINSVDTLIIANGEYPPIKYDGTTVSNLGTDLPNVKYLDINYDRLFAAGDSANPNKLYYSKAYDLGDWAVNTESPALGGGEILIGSSLGDYITGIKNVYGAILITKRNSVYRLSGQDATNFFVDPLPGEMENVSAHAIISHQGAGYVLTPSGLRLYDGLKLVQHPDALKISNIIQECNVTATKAIKTLDKVYYIIKRGTANIVLEHDIKRRAFMLRTGFNITDFFSDSGTVYFIGSDRYVYKFDVGTSYDGQPINAFWETPSTDMQAKDMVKTGVTMYLYGYGVNSAKIVIDSTFDSNAKSTDRLLHEGSPKLIRPSIRNYGRRVKFRFSNEGGKFFKLESGLQFKFNVQRD